VTSNVVSGRKIIQSLSLKLPLASSPGCGVCGARGSPMQRGREKLSDEAWSEKKSREKFYRKRKELEFMQEFTYIMCRNISAIMSEPFCGGKRRGDSTPTGSEINVYDGSNMMPMPRLLLSSSLQ
jgi:hypothetical protein